MNPLALSSFATKLGPWLGRMAAKNPTLMARLTTALKTGGRFAGKSAADIVSWVKRDKANAVLVATTLASLGVDASSLFGDSKDPDVAAFQKDLADEAIRTSSVIDAIGAKSESEVFETDEEKKEAARQLIEVERAILKWARSFFGSNHSAIEAHRMLQAFVQMPLSNVRHGFNAYNLN